MSMPGACEMKPDHAKQFLQAVDELSQPYAIAPCMPTIAEVAAMVVVRWPNTIQRREPEREVLMERK